MYVMLSSGQVLPFPVRRLYPVADGMRAVKQPLPVRGSWIVLGFLGSDLRAPFMMGAYHPNLVDALPDQGSDPFSSYESSWNGSWSYTHGLSGYHGRQWADNSSFVVGSGDLNIPTVYRHIVTSGQARQQIVYNQSDRNPNPQKPFGMAYKQAVSGGVGGVSFTVTPSGSVHVTSTVSGQVHDLKWNGATISVNASGVITLDISDVNKLHITLNGGAASDFLGLVSKIVSNYNTHTHGGIMPGGSSTDVPDQQWTSDTIKSQLINITE